MKKGWTSAVPALGMALMIGACSDTGTLPSDVSQPDSEVVADPGASTAVDPFTPMEQAFTGPVIYGDSDASGEITPKASANAHITGSWSPVVNWPLSAIHMALLPDGRVMTYGTDERGASATGLTYDIWDPSDGFGVASHLTLPVQTATNLFCSAQSLLPGGRQMLLTGGDQTKIPGGDELFGVRDVNLYDIVSQEMARLPDSMFEARWYPTITSLPNGDQFVHGGRAGRTSPVPQSPEVYKPGAGWRQLTGIGASALYRSDDWWYPRSFVAPNGKVLMVRRSTRELWYLDAAGVGSATNAGLLPFDTSLSRPAAHYRPDKVLMLGNGRLAGIVTMNEQNASVRRVADLQFNRHHSDATVLADGTVMVSGGAQVDQTLAAAVYPVEIFNPDTETWTVGASASRARLYHSSAILLPDGSVLTAGGGPPGPVVNLNAEVYYPPYLFQKDGSGRFAPRPVIQSRSSIRYRNAFSIVVGNSQRISRVALVRSGSATHSFDSSQRYIPLTFSQSGNQLSVQGSLTPELAPPGLYMLFVMDESGVPSISELVNLQASAIEFRPATVQSGNLDLSLIRNGWIKVRFDNAFTAKPAVVFGGVSSNDGDSVGVRLRNVTEKGFEAQLMEWNYLDKTHFAEEISWMAAIPGVHNLGGLTIEAGIMGNVDHQWNFRWFTREFATQPVVKAQLASHRDADAAIARVDVKWRGGFFVRLFEEEARDGWHMPEEVHYIAYSTGVGRIGNKRIVVNEYFPLTDGFSPLAYGQQFNSRPSLIMQTQSYAEADPILPRWRNATRASVDVRLQEEQSANPETAHRPERLGLVIIER